MTSFSFNIQHLFYVNIITIWIVKKYSPDNQPGWSLCKLKKNITKTVQYSSCSCNFTISCHEIQSKYMKKMEHTQTHLCIIYSLTHRARESIDDNRHYIVHFPFYILFYKKEIQTIIFQRK